MSADERRSQRRKVVLLGTVIQGHASLKVRVSNLSSHGALVTGPNVPAANSEVQFSCNGRCIPSWVAWTSEQYAGLEFAEAIEPSELISSHRPRAVQIVPDTRTLDFRRPGFRGNQLTAEERAMIENWQESRMADGDNI